MTCTYKEVRRITRGISLRNFFAGATIVLPECKVFKHSDECLKIIIAIREDGEIVMFSFFAYGEARKNIKPGLLAKSDFTRIRVKPIENPTTSCVGFVL